MDVPETVGDRIRAAQRRSRATNEELAADADVHVKTVSQWRHDRQNPTDDNLKAIAPRLGVSFAWLRTGLTVPGKTLVAEGPAITYYQGPAPVRARLSPRIYERIFDNLERMRRAGCTDDQIDEAERLLSDSGFSKLNKSDLRDRTEEEQLTDIDAAWEFIRRVIKEHEGKDL